MAPPNPLACSVFVLTSFTLAGLVQALWFKSRSSWRWAFPIDAGWSIRGRRLFGENKTWRGFVVMVPAAGFAFFTLSGLIEMSGGNLNGCGLWNLSPAGYGLLGTWAGFGFMVAELPNSFLKRQVGIAPGAAPDHPLARTACFVVDRFDSVLGLLVALSVIVPVPAQCWIYVLATGPGIHWLFSAALFLVGAKNRPA